MALGTTLTVSFDAARVQRGLSAITNGVKTAGLGFAKLAGSVAAIGAAGIAGVAALGIKINAIGEEAAASDDRLKQIVKSMGLFGDRADDVSERLLNLADTQGRLLGIDDDTIALTESKLLTFKELAATANVVGGAFDRATMAALDMAKAGFGEAEQNAVQLGKALNDPVKGITALAKSGITFTQSEKSMIESMVKLGQMGKAQNMILKAIEAQVGGTAAATATASSRIKVSLAQVVEEFAKPFAAGFSTLPGQMEGVFPSLIAKAAELGRVISNTISDALSGNREKFIEIGDLIGESIKAGIKTSFQSIGTEIARFLSDISESMGFGKSWAAKNIGFASPGELLEANAINSGLSQRVESIRNKSQFGNQDAAPNTGGKFRYANPGESSVFSDGHGNKLIEIMSKIEKNTQTGSKM